VRGRGKEETGREEESNEREEESNEREEERVEKMNSNQTREFNKKSAREQRKV